MLFLAGVFRSNRFTESDRFFFQIAKMSIILFLVLFTLSAVEIYPSEDNSVVFVREVVENQNNEDSQMEIKGLSGNPNGPEEKEAELFIPSRYWQKVKPGQVLPSGLHYRMNLQTGLKEAKLLDDTDVKNGKLDESNAWVDHTGKFNHLSGEELKSKLSGLPDDGPKNENLADLSKYRDIEELRKDFAEMNKQMKTESEIVKEITNYFRSQIIHELDHDFILPKLEDLTYYVHQIDNAEDFILKMNGLELIKHIYNHSEASVKQAALKTLSACLQSNQKLKVFAIENGQILQFLTRSMDSKIDSKVTKSAFNALSALIRNFPFAQKVFGDMSGFQLLCKLAESDYIPSHRVLQLQMDLLSEAAFALQETEAHDPTRRKQYEVAAVIKKISCSCKLIHKAFTSPNLTVNLNVFEVLIDAARKFTEDDICVRSQFKKWLESLKPVLVNLLVEKDLRSGVGEKIQLDSEMDEYRQEVVSKLTDLVQSIKSITDRSEL